MVLDTRYIRKMPGYMDHNPQNRNKDAKEMKRKV